VKRLLAGAFEPAKQQEFEKVNEALAKAADDLVSNFKNVELARADQSHVLGPDRYAKLLRLQEGIALPLSDFKAMGEANLAQNRRAYEELVGKVTVRRPKAAELLYQATRLMDASRKFVIEKKIVTIPFEDRTVLKETPPYMRWNSAFLDASGPFDPFKGSFYYITMPDKTWSAKERAEYVMPLGVLLATTVHEVYPGHFLQGQWARNAPTRIQKSLGSYSFIEGWAHYVEQMMIEEGFGKEDPQNRLGQLSDALLRNCRYVVSIGFHTEGMTLEAAANRFEKECHQDKATAREQAVRGTFDPGYFAYTLGKMQILELRDEAKRGLGTRFSLQKFHDALLSHGSPAIPLIRERVLHELADAP
jgi:hypothetical protein